MKGPTRLLVESLGVCTPKWSRHSDKSYIKVNLGGERGGTVLQDNVPACDHCVDLQMEGDGDAAAAKLLSEPTGSTTGSRRSLGIIDESQLDLSHFI